MIPLYRLPPRMTSGRTELAQGGSEQLSREEGQGGGASLLLTRYCLPGARLGGAGRAGWRGGRGGGGGGRSASFEVLGVVGPNGSFGGLDRLSVAKEVW